jgi:hypothetical protein
MPTDTPAAPVRASAALSLADLRGPASAITDADIAAAARTLGRGIGPAKVQAVRAVESRGRGFGAPDADGLARPIILYEPHVFHRLTAGRFSEAWPLISYPDWGTEPYPGSQANRWAQLEQAFRLDPGAALGAASWGLFQLMGYNFKACGFDTVEAFVRAMATTEAAHLAAFATFVAGSPTMVQALALGDWAGFARLYNGKGYAQHGYDQKLKAAFAKARAGGAP